MTTGRTPRRIGLAIVGAAGRIGLIRGEIADRGKEFATKALDPSARRMQPVPLPITPEDERV